MAGFDNVDPAYLCLAISSCDMFFKEQARAPARAGWRMMAERVFDPTRAMQRASRTREFS
jgi:hypothetical protein